MRVTIRTFLAATALAVASLIGPVAAAADSLADAMADAYRNSDLLEQNRYLLRLQDEGVAQQVAGLRPVLSFVASAQWDYPSSRQTDRLSLVASMLLYDGGGTRLARDAAQETVLATRQGLVNLEQRVLNAPEPSRRSPRCRPDEAGLRTVGIRPGRRVERSGRSSR